MTRPFDDDTEEKPLDPAVERVRRKLLRFVAINLGLLFLALMAVALAIVYKSRTAPELEIAGTDPAAVDGDIMLPAGATLLAHGFAGNRVSLDVRLADGSRSLMIYDIGERRIVARLAVRAEP